MADLRQNWPQSLHAARLVQELWPERTEHLSTLCKRIPAFFVREGVLVAFTFALSRDGGPQYCGLLLDLVRTRMPDLSTSPPALVRELSQCDPERYLLINREFAQAAQALRYAADAFPKEDKNVG